MSNAFENVVIPSSPKDRLIIGQCMKQIVDSKVRADAETALQKEIKARLKDDYGMPGALVNQWVKDMLDPAKRKAEEQKQELLDQGRHAFIDSEAQNKAQAAKDSVTGTKAADAVFGTQTDTTPTFDEKPEEVAERPTTEDDELSLDDLQEEIATEPEPEVEAEPKTMFDSAADLGNEPTQEDIDTVSDNADKIAEEVNAEFAELEESTLEVETPKEETKIDDLEIEDDLFADDFDFNADSKLDDVPTLETTDFDEVDDLFADL